MKICRTIFGTTISMGATKWLLAMGKRDPLDWHPLLEENGASWVHEMIDDYVIELMAMDPEKRGSAVRSLSSLRNYSLEILVKMENEKLEMALQSISSFNRDHSKLTNEVDCNIAYEITQLRISFHQMAENLENLNLQFKIAS